MPQRRRTHELKAGGEQSGKLARDESYFSRVCLHGFLSVLLPLHTDSQNALSFLVLGRHCSHGVFATSKGREEEGRLAFPCLLTLLGLLLKITNMPKGQNCGLAYSNSLLPPLRLRSQFHQWPTCYKVASALRSVSHLGTIGSTLVGRYRALTCLPR